MTKWMGASCRWATTGIIHRHDQKLAWMPIVLGLRKFTSTPRSSGGHSNTPQPPFDPSPSFRLTQPPNPSWKIRQGLPDTGAGAKLWKEQGESERMWTLDQMKSKDIYPLLTSVIVPRPIAFVSSLSSDGVPNLAPFSYFSMISHEPPLLSISFQLSPRRPKDTRENILATKEFTVNIISEPFAEAANSTAVEAPAEVDEWVVSGLTKAASINVKPPRVRESAVSLECELYHSHNIFPPNSNIITHTLVLGLIKCVHVRNAVLSEDGTTADPSKLRALSRLGGPTYARIGEGFNLQRPLWKTIQEELRTGT